MKHPEFLRKAGKVTLFTTIGLISYSGFLIANMPAEKLWQYLPTERLPVQPSGIAGTPWSGSAESVTVTVSPKPLVLPAIRWEVDPGLLLQGRLKVDLTLGNAASPIAGKGTAILSQKDLTLENVELDSTAQWLIAATGSQLPGEVTGNVFLQLDQLIVNDKECLQLIGDAELTGSRLLSPLGQFDLGNSTAKLSCSNQGLSASIKQESSIISSYGDFQLAGNGRYSFTGKMTPDTSLPAATHKGLALLGSPDSSNAYPLRFSGNVN